MQRSFISTVALALVGSIMSIPAAAQLDDDTYLSVSRSMGFRPASFVTVQSDYRFQLGKDRSWTYSAYDGQSEEEYKRSGKLTIPIELIEQRLADFGINDIPEPDPNAPQIADLPEIRLERELDGETWKREIRPTSEEGRQLHYLVQFIVTGVQELAPDKYSLQVNEPRRVTEPVKVDSEETLRATFKEGEALDMLAEMVDFDSQELVVFRWAGSGQDDLFAYIDQNQNDKLLFAYRGGMTRDLRQHARYFVVPKDVTWEQVEIPAGRIR